ncbi:MAG: chorismate synthase [Faecalibacterium prausnitzii]
MKNTFGSDLSLTIFGESHGRAVGAVLDGMAAGVPVDESFLAACMDKRRARGDGLSTPRVEADAVQLLSGVVNGHTTGTAIALMIEKPEHPQRRLRQDRRPSAPRPRGLIPPTPSTTAFRTPGAAGTFLAG